MEEVAQPTHGEIMVAVAAVHKELGAIRKNQTKTARKLDGAIVKQAENAAKLDKVIDQQKADSEVIEVAAEWIKAIGGMKTGGAAITNVTKAGAWIMFWLSAIMAGLLWMKTGIATFIGGK